MHREDEREAKVEAEKKKKKKGLVGHESLNLFPVTLALKAHVVLEFSVPLAQPITASLLACVCITV